MSKAGSQRKNLILVAFAKKVRSRRYELDLTQEELAEQGGLHPNFVGGVERATRNPSLLSIMKLAKALKISPKELLSD